MMEFVKFALFALCLCLSWSVAVGADLPRATPFQTLTSGNDQYPESRFGDIFGDHLFYWEGMQQLIVAAPRHSSPEPDFSGFADGLVSIFQWTNGAMSLIGEIHSENSGSASGDRLGVAVQVAPHADGTASLLVGVGNDIRFPGQEDTFRHSLPNQRATTRWEIGVDDPRKDFFDRSRTEPFEFAGQVYAYKHVAGQWALTPSQYILGPHAAQHRGFAGRTDSSHVAASPSGQWAVVGSSGCCALQDEVHVYGWSGGEWSLEASIDPNQALVNAGVLHDQDTKGEIVALAFFANGVAVIHENYFVVNAMALRGTTKELGMLFVFHRDENGQVDETPVAVVSDPIGYRNYDECSRNFGSSAMVANGQWLFVSVGCTRVDDVLDAGSVYAFWFDAEKEKLIFRQDILPISPQPFGQFGSNFFGGEQSIHSAGKYLAVGTPNSANQDPDSTVAVPVALFMLDESSEEGPWVPYAELPLPEEVQEVNAFAFGLGVQVLADIDVVAVGLPLDGYVNEGRVYLYPIPGSEIEQSLAAATANEKEEEVTIENEGSANTEEVPDSTANENNGNMIAAEEEEEESTVVEENNFEELDPKEDNPSSLLVPSLSIVVLSAVYALISTLL